MEATLGLFYIQVVAKSNFRVEGAERALEEHLHVAHSGFILSPIGSRAPANPSQCLILKMDTMQSRVLNRSLPIILV